jgi:hypothetical protein
MERNEKEGKDWKFNVEADLRYLLSCARQWKEMKENNMFGVDIANTFFIKKKKKNWLQKQRH